MAPATVLLAAVLLVTGCGSPDPAPGPVAPTGVGATRAVASASGPSSSSTRPTATLASGATPRRSTTPWSKPANGGAKITVGDVSLVARSATPSIKVYPTAAGSTPRWTLSNPLPSGAPLVFLVQERSGDRLRVLVPVRPNESQGWIRASDVTLVQHDYRIVVSIGRHRLTLYRGGKVALQVPVGLGTGGTPTPGGVFYTKELLRPPNPAGPYGPYAYGLSGYSTVLEDFGGGNGEIGIHGTNEPGSVGSNVSHGCIRMSNANITKLAGMLPLGVPVQIVS